MGVPSAIEDYEQRCVALLYPWHWMAFGDLTTERQIGMAQGPIPDSAIRSYLADHDLTPHEAWVLRFSIRCLDNHHMTRLAKQAEKNNR